MKVVFPSLLASLLFAAPTAAQQWLREPAVPRPVTRPETRPVRPVSSRAEDVPAPLPIPDPPPMPGEKPQSRAPVRSSALSLDEAEQMAMNSHPALALALAKVEAARGAWVQAGLGPNPTAGYMASEIGNEGRSGQQGAYISQEFVRGGKLGLSQQVAAAEVRTAEQNLAVQQQRVLSDVRAAFYDVMIAQRAIDTSLDLVNIGRQSTKAVDDLFKAKEVSRIDVLQAKVEANSTQLLLDNARHRHQAAWRQLAVLMGQPEMRPVALEGNVEAALPELDYDQMVDRLLRSSPQMAAAWSEVEKARWAYQRAIAEPTGNVSLQLALQYDAATQDTIAGVQVGIPLAWHDRNEGNIAKARAEVSAAETNLRRLELSLQSRLAEAWEHYAAARQQVERYSKEILPDAKSALDLVEQGYRHKEFGYNALLTAQRTYFQTRMAYFDAIRQLRTNAVRIDGMLLQGSLKGEE